MKMKEVISATGLTERTIRYYETRELIAPITEMRNGKTYRDYSEEDIAQLQAVAALRRSLFSIEQIRRMKEEPEDIGREFERYKAWLYSQREDLDRLIRAAEAVDPTEIQNIYQLAKEMDYVAQDLPLPKRDVKPNFGRFDPETPEERLEGYLRFLRWYRFHRLKAMVPLFAAIFLLIVATVSVTLYKRQVFVKSVTKSQPLAEISNQGQESMTPKDLCDANYIQVLEGLNSISDSDSFAAVLIAPDGSILAQTDTVLYLHPNGRSDFNYYVVTFRGTMPMGYMDDILGSTELTHARAYSSISNATIEGELNGQVVTPTYFDFTNSNIVWGQYRGDAPFSIYQADTEVIPGSSHEALAALRQLMAAHQEPYTEVNGFFVTEAACVSNVTLAGETCQLAVWAVEPVLKNAMKVMLPIYALALLLALAACCLTMTRGDVLNFRVGRQFMGRSYQTQVMIQGKNPGELSVLTHNDSNGCSALLKRDEIE